MSLFANNILKLLHDYKKRVLKRYLSAQLRLEKLNALGLKRKLLRNNNDVTLYQKGLNVLRDIEDWGKDRLSVDAEYSGIDEFYQHLKTFLSHYHIENNQIVHNSQKVCCALVAAIQLLRLPKEKLSMDNNEKLEECIQTVVQHGDQKQQSVLIKTLKQHTEHQRLYALISRYQTSTIQQ